MVELSSYILSIQSHYFYYAFIVTRIFDMWNRTNITLKLCNCGVKIPFLNTYSSFVAQIQCVPTSLYRK